MGEDKGRIHTILDVRRERKMRIYKKGNISPTGKFFNNCVSEYFSIWEISTQQGEIKTEKSISINKREMEIDKRTKKNTQENNI